MKRSISFVLLILIVTLVPLYLRAVTEARSQLLIARVAKENNSYSQAFAAYRRAVAWYAPLNGYSQQAFLEFSNLAFHEITDSALKLEALTELKRAVFSSRNFVTVFAGSERLSVIKRIDDELDRLNSTDDKRELIEELHPAKVDFRFQILSQLMFWSWIGSVLFCIFRGFTAEARLIPKPFFLGAASAGLFYILWLVSLGFA